MPPGSVELVIFDCDGVLIDSERLGVKVDVGVLKARIFSADDVGRGKPTIVFANMRELPKLLGQGR